jgi:MFS transporter, putative metabolite:H+ symporter
VPRAPLEFDGWRWIVLIGSAGAMFFWIIRLSLPESPRWLGRHGRLPEAARAVAGIETRVALQTGGPLPPPGPPHAEEETRQGNFADIWQPPYDRQAIMLSVFNFFQTFGYYGLPLGRRPS